ncbi:hypothetical protein PVK06_005790 [Gossypium arboreum]|uniref:Uncharacterized protein n=1 Tax=Gossypium arboreum TaxID=29729 RepID=A0ABR0QWH4_GOSAR|nr:hypothetical protein PVK06_005790 [Gossypium arboreum]
MLNRHRSLVKMLKKWGRILVPRCWSRDDLSVAKGVYEETPAQLTACRIVEKPPNDMRPLTDAGLKPNWMKLYAIGAVVVGKDLADLG